MENNIHIKRKKNAPTNGATDYDRLKMMTIEEKEENAKSDFDAQPVSEEGLKKFKRVKTRKSKEVPGRIQRKPG